MPTSEHQQHPDVQGIVEETRRGGGGGAGVAVARQLCHGPLESVLVDDGCVHEAGNQGLIIPFCSSTSATAREMGYGIWDMGYRSGISDVEIVIIDVEMGYLVTLMVSPCRGPRGGRHGSATSPGPGTAQVWPPRAGHQGPTPE